MAPYEALYGHKCRTLLCWTELGERCVLGPVLVSETEDKVRLIRDHLKAASDRQKSYTDLKRKDIEYSVGDMHYRSDPTHIVPVEEIEVRPDLTFEEEPVQILDHDVKVLHRKSIPLVKVLEAQERLRVENNIGVYSDCTENGIQ
ncbi:uncharacterized protein [Gossypium hirsutum]|uniref:Uncharacterized protein n=1 Tax=Gossypium hirsutum TaxID=3635 RepID=A0A1U8MDY4_GOSHI|nr:uncharacterized protein LOC107939696 [Gossypium hirsutum]